MYYEFIIYLNGLRFPSSYIIKYQQYVYNYLHTSLHNYTFIHSSIPEDPIYVIYSICKAVGKLQATANHRPYYSIWIINIFLALIQ